MKLGVFQERCVHLNVCFPPLLCLKLPNLTSLKLNYCKLSRIVAPQAIGEGCNIILLVRCQRSCPQKRFSQYPKLQEQVIPFEAQSVLCSSACGLTL